MFRLIQFSEASRKTNGREKWKYSETDFMIDDFVNNYHLHWLQIPDYEISVINKLYYYMWNMTNSIIERRVIQDYFNGKVNHKSIILDCKVCEAFIQINDFDIYIYIELRIPEMKNTDGAIIDVLNKMVNNYEETKLSVLCSGGKISQLSEGYVENPNRTVVEHMLDNYKFNMYGLHKNMYFIPTKSESVDTNKQNYINHYEKANKRTQNSRILVAKI